MIKKVEKAEEWSCKEECHCKWGCCPCKIIMPLIAIATLVFAILAFSYAHKSYKTTMLAAGWAETLDKMNEFYSSEAFMQYAKESSDAYIEQFNAAYTPSTNTEDNTTSEIEWNDTDSNTGCPIVSMPEFTPVTPSTEYGFEIGGTLSAEEIATLKENGVIYGPENAKLTILEFADAICGYCKRQIGQDHTVDAILSQYSDVNMMFKNMPIFNPTAAQAMACSEDYLTPEDYHHFVISVFQAEDATNVDALASLAECFGADAATIAACVNNGDKAAEVDTTMSEGSNFGISGTPSSVIINNESGKYIVVPGAYPADAFAGAIETLLA